MRVLMFLLKCLVGLFATVGLFLVVGLVLVGVLASRGDIAEDDRPQEIPERAVLVLDLGADLLETRPESFFSRVSLGETILLRDLLELLEAAGRDPRVAGLVAHVGRGDLGVAEIQELRSAISAFRAQGKFAHGFSETFGEIGNGTFHYYLATAFDRIWVQPSGDLDLTGILIESPFLRSALDELGIVPQIDQREEYKGAMASLTESRMPEAQRRNLQRLVDSWLEQIVGGLAQARGLEAAAARALVDRGPYLARDAQQAGLIDQLGYWDQFLDAAREAGGSGAEVLEIADYQRLRDRPSEEGPVIALVYGLGPISLGESENDPVFGEVGMGSDTVADAFSDAIDDEDVEAIVFRIDSPGGSYVASDTIWREVVRARAAGKPVIVSMSNLAASGGYFVSAPADKIVAQPGTVTGSIGVVAGKIVAQELWDDLEINWDGVQAGANADIWSFNRTFSAQGWQRLKRGLDRSYGDFKDKVAEGRGLSPEQVSEAAKGQVWTGADAHRLGLVDELGGFQRAVALAREAAGHEPSEAVRLRVFPRERSSFEVLLENALSDDVGAGSEAGTLRSLTRFARLIAPLMDLAERLTGDPRSQSLRAPELAVR